MGIIKKTILLAAITLILSACKNPTENIKLVIDTDILKYTALIYVTDGTNGGPAPADAAIQITGNNVGDIYDLSGKKNIKLAAGAVTIGLRPNLIPEESNPIKINVEISAAGYRKELKEVIFNTDQKQQTVQISLSKNGSTSPPVVLPPPVTHNDAVNLNFTGRCPNRSDLEIRPSVYVFFRESGSTSGFQYLGYMEKGNISTRYLLIGKTYDFQIVFDGEAYQVSQKIEQLNYNLSIDMTAACNF